MKFNINVAEDEELRNEVKRIIEGQTKRILLEQVNEIIQKVLEANGKKFSFENLLAIATSEIKQHVRNFVNKNSSMFVDNDYKVIEQIVRVEVAKHVEAQTDYVKECIETYVDRTTSQTLENMISEMVDKKVSQKIKSILAE